MFVFWGLVVSYICFGSGHVKCFCLCFLVWSCHLYIFFLVRSRHPCFFVWLCHTCFWLAMSYMFFVCLVIFSSGHVTFFSPFFPPGHVIFDVFLFFSLVMLFVSFFLVWSCPMFFVWLCHTSFWLVMSCILFGHVTFFGLVM